MGINVIFFGQLEDLTGTDKIELNYQPDTNQLIAQILSKYPLLVNVSYTVAVDKVMIKQNTILNIGATVALLPPFSGG